MNKTHIRKAIGESNILSCLIGNIWAIVILEEERTGRYCRFGNDRRVGCL